MTIRHPARSGCGWEKVAVPDARGSVHARTRNRRDHLLGQHYRVEAAGGSNELFPALSAGSGLDSDKVSLATGYHRVERMALKILIHFWVPFYPSHPARRNGFRTPFLTETECSQEIWVCRRKISTPIAWKRAWPRSKTKFEKEAVIAVAGRGQGQGRPVPWPVSIPCENRMVRI